MRKLISIALSCALLGGSLSGCTHALTAPQPAYGLGHVADPNLVALENIDVAPDGSGLPDGRGDAADGAGVYAATCERCHAGAIRLDPKRWPYATTLFDYIRRAMPPDRARLSANDLYSITAYVLSMNGVLGQHELVDRLTLPHVQTPAVGDFIGQP